MLRRGVGAQIIQPLRLRWRCFRRFVVHEIPPTSTRGVRLFCRSRFYRTLRLTWAVVSETAVVRSDHDVTLQDDNHQNRYKFSGGKIGVVEDAIDDREANLQADDPAERHNRKLGNREALGVDREEKPERQQAADKVKRVAMLHPFLGGERSGDI